MSHVMVPRSKQEIDEMIAVMRRGTEELLRSRRKARAFLIKHGFMTKGGKLTRRYGG